MKAPRTQNLIAAEAQDGRQSRRNSKRSPNRHLVVGVVLRNYAQRREKLQGYQYLIDHCIIPEVICSVGKNAVGPQS
jgi:hypothetical protein